MTIFLKFINNGCTQHAGCCENEEIGPAVRWQDRQNSACYKPFLAAVRTAEQSLISNITYFIHSINLDYFYYYY